MSVKPSLNRSSPGCVPVPGNCLSDLGYVGIPTANRSDAGFTGCVPVPGCCLPYPGYVGLGIPNMNRSFPIFTGCVPVPGSCLSGPGYVGLGISNANRPPPDPTGCAPAPGNCSRGPGVWGIGNPYLGHFGLAPARGLESALLPQVRYDDVQADSSRRDQYILWYRQQHN